jgi:hypothetical protein
MAKRVGIGHVEAGVHQARGQVLRGGKMTVRAEDRLGRLAPHVCVWTVAALAREGTAHHLGNREDTKGRDHVLAEVFVLVVAEDHDCVRLEVVERLPHAPEGVHEASAMLAGCVPTAVVAPLAAHGLGPGGGVAQDHRDPAALQRACEQQPHVLVRHDQAGIVCDADAEDFTHGARSPIRLYGGRVEAISILHQDGYTALGGRDLARAQRVLHSLCIREETPYQALGVEDP